MKLKEAQLLGILALIAVGIILLCLWGGGDATKDTETAQSDIQPAQDVSLEPDVVEIYDSVTATGGRPGAKEEAQQEASLEIGGTAVAPIPEPTEESKIRTVIETNAPEAIGITKKEVVAASGASAPEPAKPPTRTIHVVQRGETLSHISQKYYGTSRKWRVILEANKDVLSDANHLRPDMKLTIPGIEGAGPAVAVASRPALSASSPAPASRTYTVQQGDTLFRISVKCYDDGAKWRDILKANEDRISDPKRDVRPGMTLVIP